MRIHTNIELAGKVGDLIAGLPGVYFERLDYHGSRTHPRAYDIILTGNGRYGGQWGDSDAKSATWDEWGVVLGRIFELDPKARMGGTAKRPGYADAEDYRWQTNGRFGGWDWQDDPEHQVFVAVSGLPEDTHPIHRWDWQGYDATKSYTVANCKRCSAVKRWRVTR